jgi:hypothetical protein
VGAPKRLAVHGQNRLVDRGRRGRQRTQRRQPAGEAGLKGRGLEQRQHAAKDILAWNAVGQVEKLQQEGFFEPGPLGDRGRPTGPRQDGQDGDDHDADERMPPIDLRAWVVEFVEVASNVVEADVTVCHDPCSVREQPLPTRRAI